MKWEKLIGDNIRRYRKLRNMTQERLAMNSDLDLRYLGGIERGEYNPTVSVLVKLAEALEIHPRDLFAEKAINCDDE